MARRTGGAGGYRRRDLKRTEHRAQKGAKPKRKINRKPKGTTTKAGAKARSASDARNSVGTKRGRDRFGVTKYKAGTAKRKTGGSRVAKGKSDSATMYVYNRQSGKYQKTTKAGLKRMEKSGGVGATSRDKYRVVSKRTFEDAKKQGINKTNNPHSYAKPKAVRQRAGRKSRSTNSPSKSQTVRQAATKPSRYVKPERKRR